MSEYQQYQDASAEEEAEFDDENEEMRSKGRMGSSGTLSELEM